MTDTIKQLAEAYAPECTGIRRHLHAHPELSFQEHETAAFVEEKLSSWNIPHSRMACTGVVGIIEGRDPQSRIVALRADLDALPIQEENKVSYASVKPGVMHACGHDVHTACLLGAARILAETKDQWQGTVKLIFQPGEEKNPGGASIMIKEGVLQNPAPQKILGLHVMTTLEAGEFSFRGGMAMASADEIYITIRAKGGHAAAPDLTADPILIGAHIVTALQQVISRNNHAFNPSILSITAFNGGFTTNVIPSEVTMMGTFRAMNETWRFKAHELIKNLVEQTAATMGAEAEARIDVGYPFLRNDEALTATALELAKEYAGAHNVSETEMRMGAEDFSFYSQQIPACFFRLGVANKKEGITAGVHTPHFNIDEESLKHGMGMMAWLAMKV